MTANILNLMQKRKSVRKYQSAEVPRDVIERCLEGARLAPSACNSQPWSFVVADQEPLRGKLARAAFSGMYAMNDFAARAPVLIVVITERSKFITALAGRLRGVQYNLIDIGIVCAYLSLTAEEEGLGVCLLGWFDEKAVRNVLNLPKTTRIDMILSIGYDAENIPAVKIRKPAHEVWRYAGEK